MHITLSMDRPFTADRTPWSAQNTEQNGAAGRELRVAQALEATFLAEMLKSAGLGQMSQVFGGGVGEEQFSSFLVTKQAERMVERGGLGLAEQFVRGFAQEASDV